MRHRSLILVLPAALAACAVAPPSGPDVVAMPGQGKNLATFQQDDLACRSYASQASGGAQAAQAATNSAVGSAVLGTAIGAAAGAALGSTGAAVGAGAAIGGATGLIAGSAIGANNASMSAGDMQFRYDVAYAQCMTARGNQVNSPQPGYAAYPYAAYPYAYTYPAYAYPPAYYAPPVVLHYGWGWGWRRPYWHH
ncbi:MAG: glycine zipper family protein [Rhodospirillales bacterium]|nr:glycine zipper family protein [Rhodospirillales bacterium]